MPDVRIVSTTPCDCCGSDCFSCRSKGGTAILCGFPEYEAPSTPPKLYLRESIGGNEVMCASQGIPCGTGWFQYSYSGSFHYNPLNCTPTNDNQRVGSNTFASGLLCGVPGTPVTSTPGAPFAPVMTTDIQFIGTFNLAQTNTTKTWTGNGICVASGALCTGTVTASLSDEDTDENAIARLLSGASWSEWGASCAAAWQSRVSTVTFVYFEVEWRIMKSGLLPSRAYQAEVNFWRRPYGGGTWVLYQTDVVGGTTDGAGNLLITGDVPNAVGYETEARCDCVITLQ